MKKLFGLTLCGVSVAVLSSCGDDYDGYNFIIEKPPSFSMVDWSGTYEGWEEDFILPSSITVDDVYSIKKWDFTIEETQYDYINNQYEGYSFDSKYYIKDSTISDPVVGSHITDGHIYAGMGESTILEGKSVDYGVSASYQSGDDAIYVTDKEFYDSFGFYQYQYSIVDSYYLDQIGTTDQTVKVSYVEVYNEYTFEIWEKKTFSDKFVSTETIKESVGAYRIISVGEYTNLIFNSTDLALQA